MRHSLDPLALAAVGSALCWVLVLYHRLSESGESRRQLILAPSLLGLAAVVPTAAALFTTADRSQFTGGQTTSLSWLLSGLYLLGVGAVAARSMGRLPTDASNRKLLVLLLVYWSIGAVSDYYNGFGYHRVSFFLVPLVFLAAALQRPAYESAIRVLAVGSVAICAASFVLAAIKPSVAFTDPTRLASFLFAHRLAGVLEHANGLGLFAGIGVILSWRAGGRLRLVGLPICLLALVASDSRSAWFGTAAAAAVLAAGANPSRHAPSRRVPIRLFVGAGLVLLAGFAVRTYAVGLNERQNLNGRTEIWHFVLTHWKTSPIVGHGPGIWTNLISDGVLSPNVGQAHDQFFETLFTTGLVGVALLIAILFVWTQKSIEAAKQGYWLPLALQMLVVSYAVLESPLAPWGIGPTLWVLSIALFIDPAREVAVASTQAMSSRGAEGMPQPVRAS